MEGLTIGRTNGPFRLSSLALLKDIDGENCWSVSICSTTYRYNEGLLEDEELQLSPKCLIKW